MASTPSSGAPSRQQHKCAVCGRCYSRKEYVVRHIKNKDDEAHRSYVNREGGITAAALPANPRPLSPDSTGSEQPFNSPFATPARFPFTPEPLLLDLPPARPPTPPIPYTLCPLLAQLNSAVVVPPPDLKLPLGPSDYQPLPNPPPLSALVHHPELACGGTDERSLYAESLSHEDKMVLSEVKTGRPPNFAVLLLPGSAEEWEECEREERGEDGETVWWKEPTFYPDHLFQPQYKHESSSRFFMASQRFNTAWHYPWEVPPLSVLSKHAARASRFIFPCLPILHRPSIRVDTMDPALAFCLAVLGSGLSRSSSWFYDQMVKEFRVFGCHTFRRVGLSQEEAFAALQALLAYHVVGSYHDDPKQREMSKNYHPALMQYFRVLNLPGQIAGSPTIPSAAELSRVTDSEELQSMWLDWAQLETKRRVCWLSYLADSQMVLLGVFAKSQIPVSDMSIDLPAPEALWTAETAHDWRDIILRTRPVALPFHHTLNVLVSTRTSELPTYCSPAGRVLQQLPSQSSFNLAILTNTLMTLQACMAREQQRHEVPRQTAGITAEALQRGLGLLGLVRADLSGRWFGGVHEVFN